MQQLTDDGRQIVSGVAQRHGFSSDAVTTMLCAVAAGYGNQAQFNHPEFGGMGQWSSGGMVMIGDMFNNNLKGRVSALCQELSGLVQGQSLFAMPAQSQNQSQGSWQGGQGQMQGGGYQAQGGGFGSSLFVQGGPSGNWWPSDLGSAGSLGSQNNLRYAYFPGNRRLAIDVNGQVTVYDTGDHQIGGFGQQQSGDQSLTFSSQFGLVRVADLPIISGANVQPSAPSYVAPAPSFTQPAQMPHQQPTFAPVAQMTSSNPTPMPSSSASTLPQTGSSHEVFSLLEKLADLRSKGILTDAEFDTKKQELLARL